MIDDVTTATLQSALNGLAMRQRVIADNVANIQTPGFLAGRVQFEDALAQAVQSGQTASIDDVTPRVARSLEPTRTDGNNVNLDEETLQGINTNLSYQLALRALDNKYGLMSDVLKGGA